MRGMMTNSVDRDQWLFYNKYCNIFLTLFLIIALNIFFLQKEPVRSTGFDFAGLARLQVSNQLCTDSRFNFFAATIDGAESCYPS
jgi:hypothetical protein